MVLVVPMLRAPLQLLEAPPLPVLARLSFLVDPLVLLVAIMQVLAAAVQLAHLAQGIKAVVAQLVRAPIVVVVAAAALVADLIPLLPRRITVPLAVTVKTVLPAAPGVLPAFLLAVLVRAAAAAVAPMEIRQEYQVVAAMVARVPTGMQPMGLAVAVAA